MTKLVTIQTTVPICPVCNGTLSFKQIHNKFKCNHCNTEIKVVDLGKTDRELICELETGLHNV